MANALTSLLIPAVIDRALLVLNHVLAAEPAAVERLQRHTGRTLLLQWQGPSGWFPLPPDLALRVTAAGLVERDEPTAGSSPLESASPADRGSAAAGEGGLRVAVELPAPHRAVMQWVAGERPAVHVQGDAAFAADAAWIAENLRWDVEADLARAIGDGPAHELARFGAAFRNALVGTARRAADTWSRRRPGDAPASQ